MHEARRTYPLPEGEQRALVWSALASEGLLLTFGIVAAVLLSLAHGSAHALPVGWLGDIAAAMRPHWTMVALTAIMLVLLEGIDWLGTRHSETYRAANRELRQGVTGELPRLPMGWIVVCMIAAGFCEELLFRYGLLGLAVWALGLLLPPAPSAVLATALVSVAFWAAHVQYRNTWAAVLVIGISCLLSAAYLATGSLLSVMVAHTVYNIAELVIERRKMVRDPDYFGDRVPTDEIRRLMSAPDGNVDKDESNRSSENREQ